MTGRVKRGQEKEVVKRRAWLCLYSALICAQVFLEETRPWVRLTATTIGLAAFITVHSYILVPSFHYAMNEILNIPAFSFKDINIDLAYMIAQIPGLFILFLFFRHIKDTVWRR